MAFVDDVINDLSVLNVCGKSTKNTRKLKHQLYFIIQNIADAKQLRMEKSVYISLLPLGFAEILSN